MESLVSEGSQTRDCQVMDEAEEDNNDVQLAVKKLVYRGTYRLVKNHVVEI